MTGTIGIVQARLGSTRLPGKVMLPLNGRPAIHWVMARTKRCRTLDALILATSWEPENDPLAELAEDSGWACVRGAEDDVVGRFREVLAAYPAQRVARINADNFAIDPDVIDHAVETLTAETLDVCTPFIDNSYPFGAGAEVGTAEAIGRIDRETAGSDARYREHLFLYAYDNRTAFRVGALPAPATRQCPELNVSVDTAEDFRRVDAIFRAFAGQEETFGVEDMIAFHHACERANAHPNQECETR